MATESYSAGLTPDKAPLTVSGRARRASRQTGLRRVRSDCWIENPKLWRSVSPCRWMELSAGKAMTDSRLTMTHRAKSGAAGLRSSENEPSIHSCRPSPFLRALGQPDPRAPPFSRNELDAGLLEGALSCLSRI